MISRKVMAKRRPPKPKPAVPITDNSTPWVENPRTIEDLLFIARSTQELVEKWGPKSQ